MIHYTDILKDHFHNPRHKGRLADPTFVVSRRNAACGDEVTIYGRMHGDMLTEVSFEAKGCMIVEGTSSALCEYAVGKDRATLAELSGDTMLTVLGGLTLGPTRMRCVLLPLEALQEGVINA